MLPVIETNYCMKFLKQPLSLKVAQFLLLVFQMSEDYHDANTELEDSPAPLKIESYELTQEEIEEALKGLVGNPACRRPPIQKLVSQEQLITVWY